MLVESDAIGTVGVGEATIPQIHLFNSAIGLDEAEFLRETRGSFKLGIEFDGWLRDGHSYMHAFGQIGRGIGLLPFQHYWLRARQLGFAKPLQRYSLNELAARTMRMQRGRTSAGAEMPYAYHFDAGLYAALLRRHAEARGVERHEGTMASVDRDGGSGDIASITLDDGRVLAADFFIDCTGFRGLLIEGALETGFDDWSNYLPCDRAMAVPCEGGGDFTPYTKSIARKAGWQWRIPLQHRIGNGLVYSSAHLPDDEAAEMLLANLDGATQADPRPIRFTTGKRRKHWNRNCLALGLAAGFMEPLESTSIHLIQIGATRLVQQFPFSGISEAIANHYNEQAERELEKIRDFIVLHYKLTERDDSDFWRARRDMPVPDTLSQRIALFRENGLVYQASDDLFRVDSWLQVMMGQRLKPKGYHHMGHMVTDDQLTSALGGL